VVVSAGGGLFVNAPYATLALRVGAGGGTRFDLVYEAPALLGQSLALGFGWGAPVGPHLDLGFALETAIGTLGAIGDIFGIRWRAFDLGNDWTALGALVLTYRPDSGARVTARLGVDTTLADYRYATFDDAAYALDFEVRGPAAMIQGEWRLDADRHLFIRLEMDVPLHTELTPLGFVPTAAAGVAWAL
jgi:hypothetical protein